MTKYEIDPETSTVTFAATTSLHSVVARAPATGWFEADLTEAGFAPGSTVAGVLTIAVEDIKSNNPIYDAETRRRIDLKANPLIEAEITSTSGIEGETARVEGNVSFHGETTILEGEVTLGEGPTLSGEGTVDIRWWELHPPRLLAFRVEPEVDITLELKLVEAD